jgi:hypothetical protein
MADAGTDLKFNITILRFVLFFMVWEVIGENRKEKEKQINKVKDIK